MSEDREKWEKIFWDDQFQIGTSARGGMFYRTMKLGQFIKETEEKGYRIVGIRLDENNICEFIFQDPPSKTLGRESDGIR